MEFRTPVTIAQPPFSIIPTDRLLFVGSCFAANIGQRFADNLFQTVVNPYGVMYNPASIVHTLQRYLPSHQAPDVAVITLGTNHVYILKETGEIVDNCQKRPQALFREEQLSVEQCSDYLQQAVDLLQAANPHVHIILTVSPIRYAKYGFHGSQLSKATLLLAVDALMSKETKNYALGAKRHLPEQELCTMHYELCTMHYELTYFPAYEIVNDELRDYRFYAADMLHPSEQAVEYVYERFAQTFFAPETHRFVEEYRPIKQALAHKPFNPESPDYQQFKARTRQQLEAFCTRYGLPCPPQQ